MRVLMLCTMLACAVSAQELAQPFQVKVNDKPIDVEVGHAAPFVADFDGNGLDDLLVGQFGDGVLQIFLNKGKRGAPRFAPPIRFKGTVPTG